MLLFIIILGIVIRIAMSVVWADTASNKKKGYSYLKDVFVPTKKQYLKFIFIPFYWWFMLGSYLYNQFED